MTVTGQEKGRRGKVCRRATSVLDTIFCAVGAKITASSPRALARQGCTQHASSLRVVLKFFSENCFKVLSLCIVAESLLSVVFGLFHVVLVCVLVSWVVFGFTRLFHLSF